MTFSFSGTGKLDGRYVAIPAVAGYKCLGVISIQCGPGSWYLTAWTVATRVDSLYACVCSGNEAVTGNITFLMLYIINF